MLAEVYDDIADVIDSLDEVDLQRPSRCRGWVVVDVLAHLLGDPQRALVACATPADGEPDVDAGGYFRQWTAEQDSVIAARGARWTRIQASAYRDAKGLGMQWRELSQAAARAVRALPDDAVVQTQGKAIRVGELARTLVLEAVVHHLDLLVELDRPGPRAAAVEVALEVFDEMAGRQLPRDEPEAWVLRAAGRVPAPGDWVELLPLLS